MGTTEEFLKLIITADDKAKGVIKESKGIIDSFKGSWTELKSAIDLAGMAYTKIKGVIDDVVGETVEYADQVRELSRLIGATPEEASKLIQAADDVKVSYETLSGAMQVAIRKGVTPTIEGMAALAEEYKSIEDPIKRSKFLMDNFGRSGADLGPLMEIGAEGIRKLGEDAKNMGLVLDQTAIKKTRDYEIAVDDLEDSMNALKIEIGLGILPNIIELTKAIGGVFSSEEFEVKGERFAKYFYHLFDGALTEPVWRAKYQLEDFYEVALVKSEDLMESTQDLSGSMEDLADDTDLAKQSMDELSTLMGGELGDEMDDFIENQKEITRDIADLQSELDELSNHSVFSDFNDDLETLHENYKKAVRDLNRSIDEENEDFADDEFDRQQKLEEDKTDVIDKYNQKKLDLAEDLSEDERRVQLEILDNQQQEEIDKIDQQYNLKEERAKRDHEQKLARLNEDLADEENAYQKSQEKINQQIDEAAANQKKKIEEIKEKIEELNKKYEENANEHEKASKRILFDLLSQQLSLDGLTTKEAELLKNTARDWGLVDESTVTAWQKVQDYISSLDGAASSASGLKDYIDGIPAEKNVDLNINLPTTLPGWLDWLPTFYDPNLEFPGFASGGDFIVPPGFPNDKFMMGVTTGERVTVTPASNGGAGGNGDTFIIHYSPMISTADEYELERVMAPLIRSIIRKEKQYSG